MNFEKLPLTEEAVAKNNPELHLLACEHFGTWEVALEYAGIDLLKVPKRQWDPEKVIGALPGTPAARVADEGHFTRRPWPLLCLLSLFWRAEKCPRGGGDLAEGVNVGESPHDCPCGEYGRDWAAVKKLVNRMLESGYKTTSTNFSVALYQVLHNARNKGETFDVDAKTGNWVKEVIAFMDFTLSGGLLRGGRLMGPLSRSRSRELVGRQRFSDLL